MSAAFVAAPIPLAVGALSRRLRPAAGLRARPRVLSMSAAPDFSNRSVLLAKQGPSGELGDCPFTQKANLALRFRGVPFDVELVDLSEKPDWFLGLNEDGTTPTFVTERTVITSSDDIVEYADSNGTKGSSLIDEENPRWSTAYDLVAPIFGSFVKLMKGKERLDDLANALLSVLSALDNYLSKSKGKFLLGDNISALDCNLAPKLFHIIVAGKHYRDFEVPQNLTALYEYLKNMEATDEWKATACAPDVVVWGWSKFF